MSTPFQYEIRNASIEDVTAMANVSLQSWQESYKSLIAANDIAKINYENRLQSCKDILERNQGLTLVATIQGKVVGFCDAEEWKFHKNQSVTPEQLKNRTEKGEISSLHVLKAYQRKGIGHALFSATKIWLNERRFSPFLVWAFKNNSVARQFYEAQGGTLVDETELSIGDSKYLEVAYRFD